MIEVKTCTCILLFLMSQKSYTTVIFFLVSLNDLFLTVYMMVWYEGGDVMEILCIFIRKMYIILKVFKRTFLKKIFLTFFKHLTLKLSIYNLKQNSHHS